MSLQPRIGLDVCSSQFNAFINSFAAAVRATGATTAIIPHHFTELRDFDGVIFHWPYFLNAHCNKGHAFKALLHLALAKRLYGLKIIWVAHNAVPHEGRGNRLLRWMFFRLLDGIVYLSQTSRSMVRQENPVAGRTHEMVTVHGSYQGFVAVSAIPPLAPEEPCRLLTFGLVRPYKGLDLLIEAAKAASGKLHLTVLGKIRDLSYAQALARAASESACITLDLREEAIDDKELEAAIDRAHGIVLPYRKILNSGAAIHALSRNRPVLVPDQGAMPELRTALGSPWVHLFSNAIETADIDRFADRLRQAAPCARVDMAAFSWTRVTDDLARCFADLGIVTRPEKQRARTEHVS
ncbi:hypothetical protein RM533_12460 [Croceicoccus sp. F390]|uniref:Glycosyltransferase n=1 Tax=Croceicoccus esteveae TaxID=3075597 RepID=A0ABU2ZK54_9SPHN|nr:hypothetical protein [Croceicoccus sp. F390]MDT0576980.1 hypothetical protein [Croceicoccus sp. F390]